ncbi:hypothetical protein HHI36_010056 [Cryptolaemus montrouzieri]|uniref:Uncharacterized protein n=1 Tax=Cryptolaemus montrouzieri TaxID=559131 RepID=A0ABD2MHP3_9CUCU
MERKKEEQEDAVSEHSEVENDTAALASERTLIDEVDQSEERKQKKAKQIVNKKRRAGYYIVFQDKYL